MNSCDHDWEIINQQHIMEVYDSYHYFDHIERQKVLRKLIKIYTTEELCKIKQRVCLKCGECENQFKELDTIIKSVFKSEEKRRDKIMIETREKKERQKLAKKIWENCNE